MLTWKMELDGDKIVFQFPYDQRVVSDTKMQVPGARWNPATKSWRLPKHYDTCTAVRQLSKKHKAKLDIGPALFAWATSEKARIAEIPSVDSFETLPMVRLEHEYPHTYAAIKERGFQTVGATFMARNRSALNADQPGLGKTIQTISAVVEAGRTGPILVVAAPKSAAVLTWPAELAKWAPNDNVVLISGAMKPAERQAALQKVMVMQQANWPGRVWVVTSPYYIRFSAQLDMSGNYAKDKSGNKIIRPVSSALQSMLDIEWSAIIVDEAHKTLAGVTSMNKKKWSAQRLGLDLLRLNPHGLRIALSGTPFRGKEANVWGILNWLRPDLYTSGWRWIEKHFQVFEDPYGKIIGDLIDEEEFYRELRKVMVRRTKGEVAKDLPPKRYGGEPLDPEDPTSPIAVWLPMEGAQATAYKSMVKSASADLEGGELTANGVLAELTRLKQFACSTGKIADDNTFVPSLPSNKFDWLVDFLDERGIDKDMVAQPDTPKVIVASQFTKLLDLYKVELEKLGIGCHVLTGATSERDRVEAQDDWQNSPFSKKRVFLLNTIAGGAAITLDAADEMVTLDETWNKDDQEQVEDRIHRVSRVHNVTIWNLRSKGSIEENISTKTSRQERNIKSIIDGQRGVEFAIQLLGR